MMMSKTEQNMESGLPKGVAKLSLRALHGAGYFHLDQLSRVIEEELLQLHGMGPKTLGLIRQALEANGLLFANHKD